jgi:hypothetical protein
LINVITYTENERVLRDNLLKSDFCETFFPSIQRGYTNIPQAYNAGTAPGDINIYIQHDVFLPKFFYKDLEIALKHIPDDWGVMGLAGVRLENNRRQIVGHIIDRGKDWGKPIDGYFATVDTLDELILITQGDLAFDEQFEQDFYGADVCMQVKQQGRKSYVFKGFCDHNSNRAAGQRSSSFYVSQERYRAKWKDYLPIATTCGLITK